jgi:hypothetical protein
MLRAIGILIPLLLAWHAFHVWSIASVSVRVKAPPIISFVRFTGSDARGIAASELCLALVIHLLAFWLSAYPRSSTVRWISILSLVALSVALANIILRVLIA